MNSLILCLSAGTLIVLLSSSSTAIAEDAESLEVQAWEAWQGGRFDEAAQMAAALIEDKSSADIGLHILTQEGVHHREL